MQKKEPEVMAEDTLLSPTNVWLFGRKVADLEVKTGASDPFSKKFQSNNNFLSEQLKDIQETGVPAGDKKPVFARIYGFAYAGTYYELETPALYLVHGPGDDATKAAEGNNGNKRFARAPLGLSTTGIAAADFQFADDVRVWAFDKGDFSIRLDVSTGPLDQILLDMEGCDSSPGVAGARVSGARVSGARVSGARVSGARVSGARVSGARVSGARLSGD